MASLFAHGFVAVAAGHSIVGGPRPWRFWIASVLCSCIPDADVIGFAFGIRYEDALGHRGFSHSLLFAALLSAGVVYSSFRESLENSRLKWLLLVHFFVVTASHGLLDAMTDGGLGIAFFAPFDNTRYFLPWRPIAVSPIGIRAFFSAWGLEVLITELVWVGFPVAVVTLVAAILRRKRNGVEAAGPKS
jgi:inner membrane protein